MKSGVDIQSVLKQVFGFSQFRPLQEQIIQECLEGRDVFALLPTGGGKSLCFQLPALIRPGLTVVVSPLIALMKDQVDALQSSGVPATFLNSSIASGESRERLRGLHTGQYKLLYVAPERLLLSGMLDDLRRWNLAAIAVDEAHCISEWGHDFRPEYRQIRNLREIFPEIPFMALTATATERVRKDIVEQLHLRQPSVFVASFNRPNLTYRVTPRSGGYRQVLDFIRTRPKECGIVYCLSRAGAESLAERLKADGIKAAPYHAGLESSERARNQEMFLRDEIRVMCATIAFGMGVNKPNVRFVIHHDLPKNVEGYYQETGRAGRDGLPSECLLLFSAGDVAKQQGFIDEKTDEQEKRIARAQLQQMVHFAEIGACRRVALLDYFGEEYPETQCGGCDNCLAPRTTYDGTIAAQKLLSCVYRIRQKSGFGVGLNHVVTVLTGGETDKVRQWRHETLSTYGIGTEHSRNEWGAIGRELIRLGLLHQNAEKFNTLEITPKGVAALRDRQVITLTKPREPSKPEVRRVGEIACDELLFERLRLVRKELADQLGVPPYIVFGDNSLRQMARNYPQSNVDFLRISGVGDQKLQSYGRAFMAEITDHLVQNPRQLFADDSFETPDPSVDKRTRGERLNGTTLETLKRFNAGASVAEIASERGLAESTVYGHIANAAELGESIELSRFFTAADQHAILQAFSKCGFGNIAGAVEELGGRFHYGQLKVFRSVKQRDPFARPR